MPKLNLTRFLTAVLAVFLFTFLYEALVHGHMLMEDYRATQALWRGDAEMQNYFGAAVLSNILKSLLFAFIFTCHYEAKGLAEGARYGLYVGALLGVMQFATYAYMPIPLALAAKWLVVQIVYGVLAGTLTAAIYRKPE